MLLLMELDIVGCLAPNVFFSIFFQISHPGVLKIKLSSCRGTPTMELYPRGPKPYVESAGPWEVPVCGVEGEIGLSGCNPL